MKRKNLDYLIYPHVVLLLWASAFLVCLNVPGGGKLASVLAIGNLLFLFVNIPFALISLALNAKGRFSEKYRRPIAVLSFLNIAFGVMAWAFVVLLLMP